MVQQAVYDMTGKKLREIELNDAVFAAPVKKALMFEAVNAHRSNLRQGTVKTKTRAEVAGSGKKIYRQKGTGRARHGDGQAPIFVGGGTAFGPKPRDWSIKLPQQKRKKALISALSMKKGDNELIVVENWNSTTGKTKEMTQLIKKWEKKSCLFVMEKKDETTLRSMRNIPNVKVVPADGVTVYDILRYDALFMTEPSVGQVSEGLLK